MYEESYWIKMVSSFLDCIDSLNIKLEAIHLIVKSASIPWCSSVREIANSALTYSHPLVGNIEEEINREPRLVILKKDPYALKNCSLATEEHVWFYICVMGWHGETNDRLIL